MDELLITLAWLETLDFSHWDDAEDEQQQWVALRAAPIFDEQWTRVLAMIEVQEENAPMSEAEHAALQQISEAGFSIVMKAAFVNQLADCAVDDFDLIARAARVGMFDFWLQKLRAEYEDGRFPRGTF